jgi:hypothetical protein
MDAQWESQTFLTQAFSLFLAIFLLILFLSFHNQHFILISDPFKKVQNVDQKVLKA